MKITAGNEVIDKLLGGGYENDTITIIYGPAGSGKTNACLHASISTVQKGQKVIYIDTEGGFSVDRFQQLEGYKENMMKNLFFLRPTNFAKQKGAFEKLNDMTMDNIGLIVVDSIAMLYRLAIGKSENVYNLNKELGRQILLLAETARKKKIPIIITNQVYASMDDSNKLKMVGGDLLIYQSKCLIELKKEQGQPRFAVLRKHRSLPEDITVEFVIVEKGMVVNSDI